MKKPTKAKPRKVSLQELRRAAETLEAAALRKRDRRSIRLALQSNTLLVMRIFDSSDAAIRRAYPEAFPKSK